MFDVLIAGGGPAGLSAALMLGRCRRRVLLCDEGRPRNGRSRALHGYLTRDGIAPSTLNAIGRDELRQYGVECRSLTVETVTRDGHGFTAALSNGSTARARFFLIATGVMDELPALPGLEDCYGRSVFHCPYCDGWEHRDRPIAVFGQGRSGALLTLSMKTWSADVVLCTDGVPLEPTWLRRLERNGLRAVSHPIARCVHHQGQLAAIEFNGHPPLPRDVIFFTTAQRPRCQLAASMGCAFNGKGTVKTSLLSETNVPGVFVAGDASHDAQFVVVAAAEGAKAALGINQALQRQDLRR